MIKFFFSDTAEASRYNFKGDFEALSDKGRKRNFVIFLPGINENFCNVTINDDYNYEPNPELFYVHAASDLDNDFINKRKSFSTVIILPDPTDGKLCGIFLKFKLCGILKKLKFFEIFFLEELLTHP